MGLPFKMSPDVARLNPGLGVSAVATTVTPSKYHNARAEAHGMSFQSGHEAAVVGGLVVAEENKAIFNLRLQVRFPLDDDHIEVYVADAVYSDRMDGKLCLHVIDAKGMRTRDYIRKAKKFKARYGQAIEEV